MAQIQNLTYYPVTPYLVIAISFYCSALFSQSHISSFQHLSQEKGLSQGTNSYILQDSRGFIWISSAAGLNRFDGKEIKVYQPALNDSNSLASGLINSNFFEDKNSDLWFTSNFAIQRYLRIKDHFETIRVFDERDSLVREDVMAFHLDKSGNIWLRVGVGAKGRLHIYNTTSRRDSILYPLDGQRCVAISDNQGNVKRIVSSLFGETWGFEIIDHINGKRERYFKKGEISGESIFTTNVWVENSNTIWFGSNRGLLRFDAEYGTYENYDQFKTPIGVVWSVAPWNDKLFVATSQMGIILFDLKSRKFIEQFANSCIHPNSLRQNNVYELYLDPHQVLWASLWHIGVDYTSLIKPKFESPLQTTENHPIWSIIEGPDGEIWCTTDYDYLILDRHHEVVNRDLNIPNWNRVEQRKRIPLFFKDRIGRIWFSNGYDIIKYNDVKRTFESFCRLPDPAHDIITLSNGRILVSTNIGVLELKDFDGAKIEITTAQEFLNYPETSFETIYEDDLGHVYISKNSQSLLVFQIEHNNLKLLAEIQDLGDCKAFLERQGTDTIWISTDAGVLALDRKTFAYRPLQEKTDGLPTELYYSMVPDNKGQIWLSGNKGIIRYDPKKKEYHRYSQSDGLQSIEFNTNAFCPSSSGEIWMGGTNGLNVFNPEHINPIPFTPQVQITNLYVNDEPYITDTYIGELTDLSLDYKRNTLSFEFVGLEFSDPDVIQYRYHLSGIDNNWIENGTKGYVRYPNLAPGKYQLEIVASNSDGIWDMENPRRLNISIAPPFTQTIWFYALIVLAVGSITYLLYRFQLTRKLEIAEKKRLLEMDDLKNRLYTNITHEFRTPLTLIHGPVSLALTRDKTLEKKDLRSIFNQSERLQQLINQMLDLQKLDAGRLAIKYEYGNVVQLASYLLGSFETAAKEKNIQLVFSSSQEENNMDYDKEKFTQIISNLLSNAIKHTPANGKISMILNTNSENKTLSIKIQDTGVGIDPADLPYIFDRFYQSSRAAIGGTGIGLELTKNLVELLGGSIAVESTLNFGTTFTVLLPITTSAQKGVPEVKQPTDSIFQEAYDDEALFTPQAEIINNKPIALIVEDHPEVLKFIVMCLSEDFMTMTAVDGDEGIREAFEHTPDIIISDIMMPGKDGFELCNILKNDIHTSHIPIILLTGRSDQAALMAGIEQGADAYVVKPFDPDELVLRAKKLLELRTNLSQHYRLKAPSGDDSMMVKASPRENAFLQKTRAIIEEHMNDSQFSMQMLSHHMAMSHSQIHRKISALTGQSIGQFVRSVRLTKAIDLLRSSDLTVSEIAYEIGFSDPGYFGKVFAKEYNMSPSEYRSNPI